jgi:acetylornithine deacetylase
MTQLSQNNRPAVDREKAIALLRDLIAAQRLGEDAVQAIVADRLETMGARVERIVYSPAEVALVGEFAASSAVAPGLRTSIVGTLSGDASARSLLMFAHPDSEPVNAEAWRHDPFASVITGGRLHGWGVADDLAGIAAGISAMATLAKADPRGRGSVIMASTPSKRHARGIAAVLRHGYMADAALYLHPAESGLGLREVKALAAGQIEFRVIVEGRQPMTNEPGHTAFAHCAVNPIDKAFVIYEALQALNHRRGACIHHPVLDAAVGRSTNLQVSNISCGNGDRPSRLNLRCVFAGAVSFPPSERMDDVQAQIQSAITAAAQADEWLKEHSPVIEWISGVSGTEVAETHPFYKTVTAAIADVASVESSINPMHTSSDIRNPNIQSGIPTLGIGSLCGNLTQVGGIDEWVDVEDYVKMVTVTASVIANWTTVAA